MSQATPGYLAMVSVEEHARRRDGVTPILQPSSAHFLIFLVDRKVDILDLLGEYLGQIDTRNARTKGDNPERSLSSA